ncbi:MAG: hypothetical protein GX364_00795 [Firmicutes bacterium]|nr:hypothetical protein [Bacillota bacterium]
MSRCPVDPTPRFSGKGLLIVGNAAEDGNCIIDIDRPITIHIYPCPRVSIDINQADNPLQGQDGITHSFCPLPIHITNARAFRCYR